MWLPGTRPLTTLKEPPAYGGSLLSGHVKYREFLLRALGHHMILSTEAYRIHRFEYSQDLPFSALALTWKNLSISLHSYITHTNTHTHTHTESPQTVAIRIICFWMPMPFQSPSSLAWALTLKTRLSRMTFEAYQICPNL